MKKNIILYSLLCLFPALAQPHTLEADYAVNIGFFDAAKLHVRYAIDDKSYALETNILTSGFFDTLYPFWAQYRASGRFVQNALETADYHYQTQTRSHRRTKRLIFDSKGALIARESSKDSKTRTSPVEPSDIPADAFDLQSVFAFLNRQIGRNQKCGAEMVVYDGKKNFRVRTRDEGHETLSSNPSLKLMRCSLYIETLAQEDEDLLWQSTADQPMTFWLAFEPETQLPYIVQIQIASTPLGELSARLENLKVRN